MSRHDYEVSHRLLVNDPPFYALIMAAMRKADSTNSEILRTAYPWVWQELAERYESPGGVLPSERSGKVPQRGLPEPSEGVLHCSCKRWILPNGMTEFTDIGTGMWHSVLFECEERGSDDEQ